MDGLARAETSPRQFIQPRNPESLPKISARNNLRERAIAALKAGETQAEVAARFDIHKSTLEKWWYRWQTTGRCAALPHASGPERTLQACQSFIGAQVKKQPDVTLAELCERVAEAQGLCASPSMMCRELQHLELPRKKVASR